MSPKKWSKNTFGWARAEVLGALINAVFLVALCLSITIEAFKRFIEPEDIKDPPLLVTVGVIGLLVNVIGLFLFHEHGHSHVVKANRNPLTHLVPSPSGEAAGTGSGTAVANTNTGSSGVAVGIDDQSTSSTAFHHTASGKKQQQQKHHHHHHHGHGHGHGHGHSHGENDRSYQMNMRGVFLHVLSDALGSVIVICSAIVFWKTEWKYRLYIDPALSIVLVVLILQSVWPLLRDSALILLQTVPTHIQVDAIEQRLLAKVDGVIGVHEFHVWQLAGDRIIASAHIRCRNLSEYMKIAEQVKEFFHNEGIHSTTMQPEFIEDIPGADDSLAAFASSDEEATAAKLTSERLQRQLQQRYLQQSPEDCVLDCPKTQNSCVQSTCCGPSKQERDNFVMPIVVDNCRQRSNNTQNEPDSENGALLSYGNYSKLVKNQNRNAASNMASSTTTAAASSSRSNDV